MIKRKTYNTVPGLNYIQDADLVFAKVYVVELNGTEYDQYNTGMNTNRSFIHTPSDGKVTFPLPFDPDAKVFVLYKPLSGLESVTPPGVCVPGAIIPIVLPNAIFGVFYSQTINLTGTAPFTITGVTLPAGLLISNSGNTVLISGTPTTPGISLIEFNVNNCVASVIPFNQSIEVYNAATNFFVSNLSNASIQINSITGIGYAIQTGSFPITYFTGITGVHGSYTGTITLNITGIVFPQTLTLKKNSVDLETIVVSIDGDYTFISQSYLSTDEILIILN